MTAQLTITNANACQIVTSLVASASVLQEYTITDPAKTYQFMPFTTDPPDCPVTYTYLVNPGAAVDAISFDEASRTFTFFYDQDVNIAMDTPYGIMITGTAGVSSPVIA